MSSVSSGAETSHIVLHPYKLGRVVPGFVEFIPFVKVSDTTERDKFLRILRALYDRTAKVWMPGSCHATSLLEQAGIQLTTEDRLEGADLSPRSYLGGAHFFLMATMAETHHDLVVDPFGTPTTGEAGYMDNRRTIIPFFGEIEQGSDYQQRVYSNAQPLGDRGYYTFRP